MGPVLLWDLSVLLPEQGEPGSAVGSPEGKPQDHDLPEDGTGTKELLTDWRDPQGEEEAHIPLR